ncbi:MAG: efflux RND transporter permease subunit, partial [SAR324 cluster bacterium]|nr:efflux RND transporter permease subunit [SAR324 cluster bacterium]
MANHGIAANFLMLACIIGGLLFLTNIKQEVFPDFEVDAVRITVGYPGASPEDVESGIVLAIEEAVSSLDGVEKVRATAQEQSATITVEALVDANLQKLAQDIQSAVDRITNFPEEAEEPQVRVLTIRHNVLFVVLYGTAEAKALHELAEQFRDRLLQDPNITQVDLAGVRPLEISIEIPQEKLLRYKLTFAEVARRLRNASIDLPGGSLKTDGGEILVRMKERREYGQQFARLPVITTRDGSQVMLEDIAEIKDGYEKTDYYAVYNGLPAVMVRVYRVGDQTPIQVSESVRTHLEEFRQALPAGVKAAVLNDRSTVFAQRIDLLLRNGSLGLLLVLVVLSLFLEFRLAFWVMMGIPISFLGSFLVLPALGVSINMVSLFAYLVSLGIVVDDAIIVGENIYLHRQKGVPYLQAAILGAREMAMPVTFSILTNIAAFMPLYFMPGVTGKIFQMIPLVVVTVFLISLAESLFVLPAHLGHQKFMRLGGLAAWLHDRQQGFGRRFDEWVRNRYGAFLNRMLRHRYLTIVTAISMLIVTFSYVFSGRMGLEMFPRTESDFARVSLTMPYGIPVEKTETVVKRLLESAHRVAASTGQGDELVEGIFAEIGKNGSHKATITAYLAQPDVRKSIMSTGEFTNQWRKEAGEIAGVKSLLFQSDLGGPGSGQAITIELSHRNLDVLKKGSAELVEVLRSYPNVKDVNDGFTLGKQQLDFSVLPEGKSLGLTAQDVAMQVRNAYYGAEVLRQQRQRNEIKVMLRLPERERISEYSVQELMLLTKGGRQVPLRDVVRVERGRANTSINRSGGRRNVRVEADVTPRSRAGEILSDIKATELPRLAEKYPGLRFNFAGRHADMKDSLASLKISFPLAMLAIFAMLAIPFRSYLQPLIVMASIPFGAIGAILGHLLMGYALSIVSMLGLVALSGVVVNDSLILIDRANRLRAGAPDQPRETVIQAAVQRFRPIVLTTLTTFGGLTPMIWETSLQARFLIPMALSLGFGVLFATLITLVLVPCLYLVVEDVRNLAAGLLGK